MQRHALSCVSTRGKRLHSPMMRKRTGARLTSDVGLLLSSGIRLLVRHETSRESRPGLANGAFPGELHGPWCPELAGRATRRERQR